MKNILILNGSLRKKTTYSLLKNIEDLLGEYTCEFVNISDFHVKPCVGCENCLRKGECFIDDDAQIILDKMILADAIVIGSPVYLRQISGYLKMLFDRGCAWYHRSPLVGKPIFFVISTQASGAANATRYLKDISLQWGTIYTGCLSRTMFNLKNPLPDKLLKLFKKYLDIDQRKHYRPTYAQIIEFNTQKVLAKYVLPLDREFWQENDYFDKPYFYECKISLAKKVIGHSYFKLLSFFISKNKSDNI